MNIKLPYFLTQINKGVKKAPDLITGLDIGTFQTKALQAGYENGDIKVRYFGKTPTVGEALESLPHPPKRVNISVSGPSIITRYIEMPKMSKEEMLSALQFEAEKHIPIPVDQVILDYHPLEELNDNKQRILLVACKKELIDSRIELLKSLNIAINIIDIDSLAVANSFSYSPGRLADDNIFALMNIGAKFTNLHILSRNNSYLIRDIPIAGDEITRIISEKLAIPLKDAEDLKRNIPQDKEQQVLDIIMPAIDNIAQELQMSFDYLENTYGKTVNRIFISGGCCNLKGFGKLLKECIAIDTALWNPLGAEWFLDKPEFAVVAGLALRK